MKPTPKGKKLFSYYIVQTILLVGYISAVCALIYYSVSGSRVADAIICQCGWVALVLGSKYFHGFISAIFKNDENTTSRNEHRRMREIALQLRERGE